MTAETAANHISGKTRPTTQQTSCITPAQNAVVTRAIAPIINLASSIRSPTLTLFRSNSVSREITLLMHLSHPYLLDAGLRPRAPNPTTSSHIL